MRLKSIGLIAFAFWGAMTSNPNILVGSTAASGTGG
jgi:hypothetical protein